MNEATILAVVEDAAVVRLVRESLKGPAFHLLEASGAEEAIGLVTSRDFSVAIVGAALREPGEIGVIGALREGRDIPVIVVAAFPDEAERTELLRAGADVYLAQPICPEDLRNRVNTHLRWARMASVISRESVIRVGELTIDKERRTLLQGERAVGITADDWEVLLALVQRPGRITIKRRLSAAVGGTPTQLAKRPISLCVTRLRRAIEADPLRPVHIVTEPGVGYRFRISD